MGEIPSSVKIQYSLNSSVSAVRQASHGVVLGSLKQSCQQSPHCTEPRRHGQEATCVEPAAPQAVSGAVVICYGILWV